jgi:hypothetical protein
MIVQLTQQQLDQLKPIFHRRKTAGDGATIVAQIFSDGMRVAVLSREQSARVVDAVASNVDEAEAYKSKRVHSAYE